MFCELFREQAHSTWNLLRDARKANHQLKETTLTDLLIMRLKKDRTNKILVKDFSPQEESRIGADWEWWFRGRRGNWLGFRVQAKIINFTSNSFEELHYKNNHGIQCEHLISNAQNSTPIRIPLYCLYANFKPQDIQGVWNHFAINERVAALGISAVSPYVVRSLRTSYTHPKKHLKDLARFMFPWHLLVCPSLLSSENSQYDLAEKALHHWRDTILVLDRETLPETFQEINHVHTVESPPAYVETILQVETAVELPINISRVTIFSEPMSR